MPNRIPSTPSPAFVARCLAILLLLLGGLTESSAQYGGPSVLSRGGNAPGMRGRAPVDFSFYGSVRGLAEDGLQATVLDADGSIQPVSAQGVLTEIGLYGGKNWSKSSFGVDYRGDYRKLFSESRNVTRFNGWNQVVALSYQRRLQRRLELTVSQTGGTTNRAFGGFAAPNFGQGGSGGIPLNEVFDVRTDFFQSNVFLTWLKSARTGVTGGATAFFVKRNSISLVNSQGYMAMISPAYRVSRRMRVKTLYQFQRFEFPRIFAASKIHNTAAGLEYRFNRNWSMDALAGIYLMNHKGTQQVQLSPEVAEILGRTVGIAFFDRSSTAPMIDVELTRTQDHGALRMGVAFVTMPGNGLYATSTSRSVSVGYSYAGVRRLSLGVSAGYSQYISQSLQLPNLSFQQAGTGLSYRISAGLNFTAQFDYRRFGGSPVNAREGYGVSVGLAYATSRLPLAIW